MRLVKIKNKYLFKSDNPDGTHTYAVYYDRKSKSYRAVGLTHLYLKDAKRFKQINKGFIKKMKFKEFETPSGVHDCYFEKNIKGKKIDLNDKKNVVNVEKRHLSKKQSDEIKKFAKKVHK